MILKCMYCSKQFKFNSEKKRHEESHIVKYSCIICKKTFNFDSALKRHQKQHERTDLVNCILCGRYFQDKILLKRHMEYAHQGESISCSKCGATFGSDKALRVHAKSHQPKSQRRFCCSHIDCNKTFNFSHHLKHHELTHKNVKQHYCNVCGKGFIQLHHLKTHLKVHEPDKWISCNVLDCKKRFTNEYALRRHLKTHMKNNPEFIATNGSFGTPANNDKILCNYCGELIARKNLMKHANKCGPSMKQCASSETETVKETSLTLPESIDKIDEISLKSTESSITSACDIDVDNSCKNAIGGCIVTGNNHINDSCLCIKMSVKDHIQESEDIIPKDSSRENRDLVHETKNSCEDCDCSEMQRYNVNVQKKIFKKDTNFDSRPNENDVRLSFRSELKEIKTNIHNAHTKNIDMPEDLSKNAERHNIELAQKYNQITFDNIPFNSCKAVLGNCIVSGDQTIGEGCLCAKMSKTIQHNTQEFEDITPFSEIPWSN